MLLNTIISPSRICAANVVVVYNLIRNVGIFHVEIDTCEWHVIYLPSAVSTSSPSSAMCCNSFLTASIMCGLFSRATNSASPKRTEEIPLEPVLNAPVDSSPPLRLAAISPNTSFNHARSYNIADTKGRFKLISLWNNVRVIRQKKTVQLNNNQL